MRFRAKRDLLFCRCVFIIPNCLTNNFLGKKLVGGKNGKIRQAVEKHEQKGIDIVPWKVIQQTRGNMRTGPTFDENLLPMKSASFIVGLWFP
jgi:hypothetical protein